MAQGYEVRKDRERERQAEQSRTGRDIGDLPPVANAKRREKCRRNFKVFCLTYYPETFTMEWSKDHDKAAKKIERAGLHGGLLAFAMPRGSGKTTLCEIAVQWCLLYGHRSFVVLVGSDADSAGEMLESVKVELECNDLLLEDFPEVCYPLRKLEGIANRCKGQTYQGQRTRITWTDKEVVLPTIPGSAASGGVIRVAGITGRIRGMKSKTTDGRSIRPDMVIVDDPQTDDSARSESQCQTRVRTLSGAILGLAGPGKKISGFMPCTVIIPGDMADQILDRDKYPQWQGERFRMVYSFPTNEKMWDEYAKLRVDSLKADGDGSEATEFYRTHRKEMDAGAVVAWEHRHEPGELSAIQHAMNLKIDKPEAFYAEYQNDPLPLVKIAESAVTVDVIESKVSGLARGVVPQDCTTIRAFVDVQGAVLFLAVMALNDDFDGQVIDYGTYPDQRQAYFTLRGATKTFVKEKPGAGFEGALYAALEACLDPLMEREWQREDGTAMKIDLCLIDANWGKSTDIVYKFCRQSQHAARLLPSHGKYVGASSVPFSEYKRKKGERVGQHWRIPNVTGKRAIRHVLYDTNWWKSFVHERFGVATGDRGCFSIYGKRGTKHRLLAEHVTAEYAVKTEARERIVDEWKANPGHPDNHWLDCIVGCAVAASVGGSSLKGIASNRPVVRKQTKKATRRERVAYF